MPKYFKNGPGLINNVNVFWNILCRAGRDLELRSLIFVLDTLDKCHELNYRVLICMLRLYLRKKKKEFNRIKFLLINRPYKQITSEFKELINNFFYIHILEEEELERIN